MINLLKEAMTEYGASVVVVLNKQFECLIVKRNIEAPWMPNHWAHLGGGVEKGETPRDAAKREAKEEAGLTLHTVYELGSGQENGGTIHYFVCMPDDWSGEPTLNFEHTAYQWTTAEEVERMSKTVPGCTSLCKKAVEYAKANGPAYYHHEPKQAQSTPVSVNVPAPMIYREGKGRLLESSQIRVNWSTPTDRILVKADMKRVISLLDDESKKWDPTRVREIDKFAERNGYNLEAPKAGLTFDNEITIENGRNRLIWAYKKKQDTISLAIDPAEEEEFKQVLLTQRESKEMDVLALVKRKRKKKQRGLPYKYGSSPSYYEPGMASDDGGDGGD